ncbi:MAG: cache domain-containing protein [Anaerolineae bacterium]|nr:cache domain-containing protein [Anaerolineae bacterium]
MPPRHRPGRRTYIRIVLSTLLLVAGYLILAFVFARNRADRLVEARQQELRRIVDLGLASLEPVRSNQDLLATYSLEQLRREGAVTLRELTNRYNLGDNALFMITNNGLVLVNPGEPSTEFTDQWDSVDADGRYIVREMAALAGIEEDAGSISYRTADGDRIAQVVAIPEWNAFIGAGAGIQDIQAESHRFVLLAFGLALGLSALVLGLVALALRPIFGSYRLLLSLFDQVGGSPDSLPPVPTDPYPPGSDAHRLLDGFDRMLRQIRESEEAREQAVIAERNRVARELHDSVTQTLFSASVIADVLPRLWERDPEASRGKLNELRQLTRGALAEMRTLLYELRPDALARAPLEDLLARLAEGAAGHARLPVEFSARGDPDRVPVECKIALYRIAQEALNNALKHADSSHVSIDLMVGKSMVCLSIRDDGRGFNPDDVSGGGLGLDTMRERVNDIGAALEIDSTPGEGTAVRVSCPLPAQSGRN